MGLGGWNRSQIEARPSSGFAKGKIDPKEAGRKGAQAREQNWHERLSRHREELDKLAPDAIATLGKVLEGDRQPNVSPTAFGVLDRIGLGPSSKQDVQVTGSERLAAMIAELDAEESG